MNRAAACWRRISQSPLWRNRQGVAGVWFAVTLPCMIMAAAIGLNVSEWMLAASELQVVADIAAQGGAMQYEATTNAQDAANYAASLAEANGATGTSLRSWNSTTQTLTDNNITVMIAPSPFVAANTWVHVTVKRSIAIAFPIANSTITTHIQTATAVAEESSTPSSSGGGCIVALNPTASEAIRADNMGVLNSIGCPIASNSNASNAVYLNSGTISGSSVSAVGGIVVSNSGSNTFSPSPGISGAAAAADPFSTMTAPTPGACSYNNASFTAWQSTAYSFTQSANVFCGNTTIGGNSTTDTFAPGIYYFVNGNVTFNNANITLASGVTFVVTSTPGNNPGALSWTNYSNTINISAPTTGPTAGVAIWQTCPSGGGSAPANTMAGGSTLDISGAFYAPCGALNLSNNVQMDTASGGWMKVIASTIYASGSAGINASYPTGSSGGSGPGIPGQRLVE